MSRVWAISVVHQIFFCVWGEVGEGNWVIGATEVKTFFIGNIFQINSVDKYMLEFVYFYERADLTVINYIKIL